MAYIKNFILVVLFAISILVVSQSLFGGYFSLSSTSNSSTTGSVVYIENGVSGVVTITDPFLNRTTAINVIYYPLDSGSGFIVNRQGYLITALHVVGDLDSLNNQTIKTMDNGDVQRYLERAAVTEYLLNINPQLDKELNASTSGNTAVDANKTTQLMSQKNLLTVNSAQQVIKVKFPNTADQNLNASIIDVGNPNKDDDLALLKINSNIDNYDPLSISSNNPSLFQSLDIYGYPVNNNSMFYNTSKSGIKTTVSSGFVTSKTFKNGINPEEFNSNVVYDNLINFFMLIFNSQNSSNDTLYYGTNAKTAEGFSGGPVVDSKNNVMGILIFSVNSNNELENEFKLTSSLFLSSKYIIDICKKNNIPINVVNSS
jgi:hypothetical protein